MITKCLIHEHFQPTGISFYFFINVKRKITFRSADRNRKEIQNRHDEIHYYENPINVCQHVSKERCRLIE